MRTGKLSISRGHQLGELAPSAPRLSLVPREVAEPEDAPVPVALRIAPPASGPAASALVPVIPAAVPAVSPEYQFVHDRLNAIERLARLREQQALSSEEFEAEKAIVLGLPADELMLHAPAAAATEPPAPAPASAQPASQSRGPSLIGRLFGWPIIPVSLAAGLGFSFATQPQETLRFFDEALRLIGA